MERESLGDLITCYVTFEANNCRPMFCVGTNMYNDDSIYSVTMEIILTAHLVLGPICTMIDSIYSVTMEIILIAHLVLVRYVQ